MGLSDFRGVGPRSLHGVQASLDMGKYFVTKLDGDGESGPRARSRRLSLDLRSTEGHVSLLVIGGRLHEICAMRGTEGNPEGENGTRCAIADGISLGWSTGLTPPPAGFAA